MKILVIEDEIELLETICESLEKQLYVVERASTYLTAQQKIADHVYDCILMDIMLPGGNGLDLLKELKTLNRIDRIIIISAKDAIDDKVKGLELGADDYLIKPFHLAELHARVRSVIRRHLTPGTPLLFSGNVQLDPDQRLVFVDENSLTLNRKEFDILSYLILNQSRLVQKTALAEHVWGDYMDEADDFEFLYSQVKNLRKKLKEAGATAEIRAIYGIGYKLEETDRN